MRSTPVARAAVVASLVLVPVLTLVSALFASDGAVQSDTHAEVAAIGAHPGGYALSAITQLIAAWLFIPAVIGIKNLLREHRPRWADWAGGILLLGLLIAIGDGAVDLVFAQMGAKGADPGQMAALIDRYQSAAISSLPYSLAAIAMLASSIALAIGLSRAKAAPTWAGAMLPLGILTNIAGYATGSQVLLIVSAIVFLAGFVRFAALVRSQATQPSPVAARATAIVGDSV